MTHTRKRTDALRTMLTDRQTRARLDLEQGVLLSRDGRPESGSDQAEHSHHDGQEGLDFALLQMKHETLTRIDEALRRLDAGRYGACAGCGREIAARRLRALPFAVRCLPCAATREIPDLRRPHAAPEDGGLILSADTRG